MGGGRCRIVLRHIVPNTIGTVVVNATFQVADAILLVAALSFLGLGIPPPAANWGGMLSNGLNYIYSGYWWLIYPPGIAIVLTVVGVQLHRRRAARRVRGPAAGAGERAASRAGARGRATCRSTSRCAAPRCTPSTACRFDVAPGETLGLVGESGCGKTTTGARPAAAAAARRARSSAAAIAPRRAATSPRSRSASCARCAGREVGDRLPGPDDLAQPDHDDRRPGRRAAADPPRRLGRAARERAARAARAGRAAGRRATARPATRTSSRAACASGSCIATALACDPSAADRRRADDRARRDDRRTRSSSCSSDLKRELGMARAPDHPRPRRRRRAGRPRARDVRRQARRGGARPTRSSTRRGTATPRRCCARSRGSTTSRERSRSYSIPGPPPDLVAPPQRLPLRGALRASPPTSAGRQEPPLVGERGHALRLLPPGRDRGSEAVTRARSLELRGRRQGVPGHRRRAAAPGRARCTRSPACRSTCPPGRRSGWSASRAAARRRSAG